ncbi:hypothetical protein QTV49_004547 [Vibrio vulnificus]|nr:hypothetical protein [Vibrio vulnificus]
MDISKITERFASDRGMELERSEVEVMKGVRAEVIYFYEKEANCEPMLSYLSNEDGSLSFYGNIYLPLEIKEELPAYIENEKDLRQVVDFLSSEYAKVDSDFAAIVEKSKLEAAERIKSQRASKIKM